MMEFDNVTGIKFETCQETLDRVSRIFGPKEDKDSKTETIDHAVCQVEEVLTGKNFRRMLGAIEQQLRYVYQKGYEEGVKAEEKTNSKIVNSTEDPRDIRVGDEVIFEDACHRMLCVVLLKYGPTIIAVNKYGLIDEKYGHHFTKTGRHFTELENIYDALQWKEKEYDNE